MTDEKFKTEIVSIDSIKPHPRNYRGHPEDQLSHIAASIKQHGLYRNIVVAKDGTILAGHGVTLACHKLEMQEVPVIRLDIEPDSPAALKVLAGDNEVSNLGEIDDRALSLILKEVKDMDIHALLGTGYDEQMLANLVMVTRPASEIADINEASQWAGLPSYAEEASDFKLVMSFETEEERKQFVEQTLKAENVKMQNKLWTLRWPDAKRDDPSSIMFEG